MGGQRGGAIRRVCRAASWIVGLGIATASAIEIDKEGRYILTADEKAACARGGGCVMLTRELMLQIIDKLERPGQCAGDWKKAT